MNIQYRLVNIAETGYFYNFNYDYQGKDLGKLRYYLAHSIFPRPEEDSLAIQVELTIQWDDDPAPLVSNTVAATFQMKPLDSVGVFNANGAFISRNPDIVDNCLQTVVGILRGVLYKNLKGTPLEAHPLPLLSAMFFRQEE